MVYSTSCCVFPNLLRFLDISTQFKWVWHQLSTSEFWLESYLYSIDWTYPTEHRNLLWIQKSLAILLSSNSKLIVEKCQRLIQVHWHACLLASWVIGYTLMMEVTKKKRKQKVRTRKAIRNFFFCHHHLIVNSKLFTTIYSEKRLTHTWWLCVLFGFLRTIVLFSWKDTSMNESSIVYYRLLYSLLTIH